MLELVISILHDSQTNDDGCRQAAEIVQRSCFGQKYYLCFGPRLRVLSGSLIYKLHLQMSFSSQGQKKIFVIRFDEANRLLVPDGNVKRRTLCV